MTGAAFFDLDRTLLAGGSGAIFAEALGRMGIGPSSRPAVADLAYRFYEVFGETRPSMMLARRTSHVFAGWTPADVEIAAEAAVEDLLDALLPYARTTIEEHRQAGRPVVLATTTPIHLVGPFAKRVGFDDVLATRYRIIDGVFDGEIDGEFIWGRGKLAAAQEWAAANRVNMSDSYAYSDSFFDTPLLEGVGHPVAVNPDPRLLAVATIRGWKIRWFEAPEGVPRVAGLGEPQNLVSAVTVPELMPLADLRFHHLDRIPTEGGAVVVFNHRSYFDATAMAYLMAESGRTARFLGKREVFDAPVVGALARFVGGIPVDRGTGSDEPLNAAREVLDAGELIVMAPQGTIPRGSAFFEPDLNGRWGAARLAAMAGVPVIPVGLWGTDRVWPRSQRVPTIVAPWNRPRVTATVGDAVAGLTGDPAPDTEAIMRALSDLLPLVGRARRVPTDAELASTLPPGYDGDLSAEADRRPGTDT